jgi:hypothetical protein
MIPLDNVVNRSPTAAPAELHRYALERSATISGNLAPGATLGDVLPEVEVKVGGGHGGHNGLRDTHEQIGPDYRRLRVGVGHPGEKHLVTNYLTSGRPSAADQKLIDEAVAAAVAALPLVLDNWEKATQQLHSRPVEANDGN